MPYEKFSNKQRDSSEKLPIITPDERMAPVTDPVRIEPMTIDVPQLRAAAL